MDVEIPDCETCGFFETKGRLCVMPGFNTIRAADGNNTDTEECQVFGIVNVGRCQYYTTPDAAEIIRNEAIMYCDKCKHHDTVRGFHVCFGDDGTPTEPYNSLGSPEFRKEPYCIKSCVLDDYYSVCSNYKEI